MDESWLPSQLSHHQPWASRLCASALPSVGPAWCVLTRPRWKAPNVLSEHRPLLSGSSLLGVCGSLAGDVSPLRDMAVATLTEASRGTWGLGPWLGRLTASVLAAFPAPFISQLPGAVGGRRQRNWAAGSGPGGESCGKEQRHSTSSLRVRRYRVGLSGHWRDPVGSGSSLAEHRWPAPGAVRPAGRGCRPAGGYRRERLHIQGE